MRLTGYRHLGGAGGEVVDDELRKVRIRPLNCVDIAQTYLTTPIKSYREGGKRGPKKRRKGRGCGAQLFRRETVLNWRGVY